MKYFLIVTIMILLFGGTSDAQNQSTTDKISQIQVQIINVDNQLKSNPCYSPTGASKLCDETDNNKFQALQLQKSQLEKDRKAEENKLTVNSKKSQERTEPTEVAGLIFYLAVIGILGGIPLVFIIWLMLRKPNTTSFSDSHGSAAWSTDIELKEEGFIQETDSLEAGQFVVAIQTEEKESVILPQMIAARHVGVVGASGTGKSRKIFMPNIFFLRNKASVFIHDTSGELWETTSGHWTKAIKFAPHQPNQSQFFNWIPLCTDENALETLIYAETIVTNGGEAQSKDKFWDRTATALLAGIFAHTATTETPTPAFAYDLTASLQIEELEQILINSPSKLAREEGIKIKRAEDRTRKNILTGLSSCLDFMRDERVRKFTSGTTTAMDFRAMRQDSVAIYWCIPDTLAEVLRPLTCLAIRVMMNQLKETPGNYCYLMLDEFDTLGRVPKFEADITLLRKQKVIIVAGVQSLAQLEKNYDREGAKIILEGLQSIVILSGLKDEIAERVSKWLGEFTVIENSVSTSSKFMEGSSTTVGEKKHARRLMTADEVRRIDDSVAVIISTNKKPFLKTAYWYDGIVEPHQSKYKEAKTITQKVTPPANNTIREPPPDFPDFIQ
jgi:type IV secretory pathway TraG/TraD family ATPase VirD4